MPSLKNKSQKILNHLYSLKNFGIKPGLSRIKGLLKELGNPEKDFKSVLVAGTNGKGSVSALLAEILQTAGYKTGLYTSPHLYRFNERIRVNGSEIPTGVVISLAEELLSLPVVRKDKTTFFELTTAMAFKYFSKRKVDIAVVEVGLGGRYDATNVVHPLVSVVTSVGLDHEKFLGSNLSDICREKAGVIKNGGILVSGVRDKKLAGVLKKQCSANKSAAYFIDKDFKYKKVASNLKGEYQKDNIATVLEVVRQLKGKDFKITDGHIKKALKTVQWKCRMEEFKAGGVSVMLDSAHNGPGAKALATSLKKAKYKKLTLVIGAMKYKDISSIFKELLPLTETVILTSPNMERSATTGELKGYLRSFKGVIEAEPKVSKAVKRAVVLSKQNKKVCVTGSIFTAAEARRYITRYMN